jgi:thiamine-phosphate diphosphorylase
MLVRLSVPALIAVALLLPACSGGEAEDQTSKEAPQGPREVQTLIARTELLNEPVKAFGTIAAKQSSAIGALTEGPVERIFVKVGDRVSRGQPLFRIRQADYHRNVAEAKAAVDLATAQAIEAERRYERVIALAPKGFVSKAQVDAVETQLAVARAQKAQANAALGTAQQALSDTITRAPYDGVVTARLVDEGVYLNNRFSGGGQSAALELQELGTVAAIVNAPQEYVDMLRRDMPARVFIEGFDAPFESIVYIINDRVDIALAVEADGVHVGQTDMPVEMVRALLGPGAIIGLSITNHQQISRPDAALPDYLGLGPLYLQQTKPNAATPLGVEGFRTLRAATSKPVVAIGGLKADNSAPVLAAGANGLAVVSAIVGAPDVRVATEGFIRLFGV